VPAWPMPNLTHAEAFFLGLSLLRVPARAELLRSSVVPGVRGGVAARTHQCNPSSSLQLNCLAAALPAVHSGLLCAVRLGCAPHP
jgi:hypothetical protein